MGWIKAVYQLVERTLFNSFLRKLLGCMVPLLVLLGILSLQTLQLVRTLRAELATLPAAQTPDTWALLHRAETLAVAIPALALVIGAVAFITFRMTMTGPLRTLTTTLQGGDFSQDLTLDTHDEIRRLADAYNGFAGQIRDILGSSKQLGLSIAVGSTRTTKLARDASQDAERQGDLSSRITVTSQGVAEAISQVAQVTHHLAITTQANLSAARMTHQELTEAGTGMAATNGRLVDFTHLVARLAERSERISDVVQLIEGVAAQTKLLALNASIEAAHAGEVGKGFAVVADEVRKLSEDVGEAAEEIGRNLGGMLQDVEQTSTGIQKISGDFQGTAATLGRASDHFTKLVGEFEENTARLTEATQAVENISGTSREIHVQAQGILDLSSEARRRLQASTETSVEMNQATEKLLGMVSRFRTGTGELEAVIQRAIHWRDAMQSRIEGLAASGVDVFDRTYRPVPHTIPEKFLTSYAEAFARTLQPVFDEARRDLASAYAVALDVNGYLAIHHSGVSEPLTGDPQVDLQKSRHQRIYFTVETEKRRSRNSEPFLFQTYMRDTGEILNDLSMPIHIQGRHWGAMVTGFSPERFLQG